MAHLLESLVSHFDLCVTAIKHTEGGSTAVQNVAHDLPDGVSVAAAIATTEALKPLSDQERAEMLDVLDNDAAQLEDVVLELRDYIEEMEDKFAEIQSLVSDLTSAHADITAAFKLLDDIGTRLPAYISASTTFRLRWEDEKAGIKEHMEELDSMRDFYDGFTVAYDGLLVEIGRRKAVEERMEKVVSKAMREVEKLRREDEKEREGFRKEAGDWLPSDLWPGVGSRARRWEITVVPEEKLMERENKGGDDEQ